MAKSKYSKNRRRVTKLWNKDPHCHWCKILTVRVEAANPRDVKPHSDTFDHLYHRTNPLRHTRKGRHKGVLACYECNQRRGREAHIQSLPYWNRWIIKLRLPIPVWKVRRVIGKTKKRWKKTFRWVSWLKRYSKYRLRNAYKTSNNTRI